MGKPGASAAVSAGEGWGQPPTSAPHCKGCNLPSERNEERAASRRHGLPGSGRAVNYQMAVLAGAAHGKKLRCTL